MRGINNSISVIFDSRSNRIDLTDALSKRELVILCLNAF